MRLKNIQMLILSLFLSTFMLAGCMNVDQQLWINSDGSGRMVLDIGVSEKNFLELQKGEEALAYLYKSLDGYQETLKKNIHIKNLSTRQFAEGEVQHRVIEFDVTDFEAYFEGIQKFDDPYTIRLETLDNGDFRFTEKIIPGGSEWLEYYFDYFEFRPKPSQLDSFMSGYSWVVQLYTPTVVSADGSVDPKTNSITWDTALDEIYKLEESKSLTAIYQTQASTLSKPWFPYVMGAAVFIGVFGLGVLFLGIILLGSYLRQRKKTNS